LQTLQVGAQNQNTVGLPAAAAPSKVPPPTRGAVNWSASGTTVASVVAGLLPGEDVPVVSAGTSFVGVAAVGVAVSLVWASPAVVSTPSVDESEDSEAQAVAARRMAATPMAPAAALRCLDLGV
jgi:hypothetical protein